ncbi:hypothetical protein DP939_44070 [Spongiactinospora rosea]|uniref:Allantoicase domain-containing protein n=1 Tax=Spongiactinospora rosea TaxID=2248750 RepID=A0A366LIT9_9ACTN|nr:hypothetical protein [Spongiactinospora rosea]RBQ13815.1 hypothetical protein DP939_44070 [Spongiactinospora rosea]
MTLNLLARELGASVVDCSDEFFGAADALLLATTPQRPGTYGLRGADVDGWESRRHNPDHDWVVIRAAHPGRIERVELETTGFRFNAPRRIGVDVSDSAEGPWQEILADADVQPNTVNEYPVADAGRSAAFVRLRIFPDGGVARFRAFGVVDVARSRPPEGVRLSDIRLGCRVRASEGSFGDPWAVISHAMPRNTHDGWETPRRSDADRHFAELSWPEPVRLRTLEVVATPFRGNCAARIAIEASADETSGWAALGTFEITSGATTTIELPATDVRHVRVRALPDGGFSRLWFYGARLPLSHPQAQE